MTKNSYHIPVMLKESIEGLRVAEGGIYVDATYGGGGHSDAILQRLGSGKLVAFDQDDDAGKNLPDDKRLIFVNHNFRYLKNFLKYYGLIPADGILADLGVSSHQIDKSERGFSTRYDGPLDMRMNRSAARSAETVIRDYEIERLASVFRLYGELRNARRVAGIIAETRENLSIDSTHKLVDALKPLAPRGRENKFYARVFQALRIEVNDELASLKALLEQATEVLKPGGRLVVISYHSLEDRLVKNFMKTGNFEGIQEKDFFGRQISPLNPVLKMQIPGPDEIRDNSRARSAKLRIAEKTDKEK